MTQSKKFRYYLDLNIIVFHGCLAVETALLKQNYSP